MTQQCWYSQHWRHMYENQVYTRPGLRKGESSYYKLQVYDPTVSWYMYKNQVYTRPGLRKRESSYYKLQVYDPTDSQHWSHMYVYTRPGLRKRKSSYYKLQVYDPTVLVQSALASHAKLASHV